MVRGAFVESIQFGFLHSKSGGFLNGFRHPFSTFLNLTLIFLILGSTLLKLFTPQVAYLSEISIPNLIQAANQERTKAGLPPLKENPSLAKAAQMKGEHMIKNDYFEHTSPDSVTSWFWFDQVGYDYLYAGENLAIDFSETEEVVSAWMQSEGHRRNLLSERYDETGMAVVTGEFEGRTATVVVHLFGNLDAEPGTVATQNTSSLVEEPEVIPSQITIESVLTLPSPSDLPGETLLTFSVPEGLTEMKVSAPSTNQALIHQGDNIYSLPLSIAELPPTVSANDSDGKPVDLRISPPNYYSGVDTPTPTNNFSRLVRTWMISVFSVLLFFLPISFLIHLKNNKLRHSDLLMHLALVISFGAIILFFFP